MVDQRPHRRLLVGAELGQQSRNMLEPRVHQQLVLALQAADLRLADDLPLQDNLELAPCNSSIAACSAAIARRRRVIG